MKENENASLPAAAASPPPCARDIDALVIKSILKDIAPKARCGCCVSFSYSPSTDPVASKDLLDKMRADGWNLKIWVGDLCTAQFCGFRRAKKACASELAMAVALAALNAVGVDLQGASADATPQADKDRT